MTAPNSAHNGEKCFRKIINNIAKRTIPAGRIKTIIPEVPTEAATKMKERDDIRQTNPTDQRLPELNKEINDIINEHKREKWRETIEKKKSYSSKLFKLIKHLNGGTKASENEDIKFKGKYISAPKKIADNFNKQFSSIIPHKSSKTARSQTKNIRKKKHERQH